MSGHGHVTPNPDGSLARCGGPPMCNECARELAALRRTEPPMPADRYEAEAARLLGCVPACGDRLCVGRQEKLAAALRAAERRGVQGAIDAVRERAWAALRAGGGDPVVAALHGAAGALEGLLDPSAIKSEVPDPSAIRLAERRGAERMRERAGHVARGPVGTSNEALRRRISTEIRTLPLDDGGTDGA